ncbi:MAG: hypothetical protein KJ000_04295 [Pirellulaceae bacterium]|nr:hypothetical protein [Pirellulaceae bacterium]
MRCWALVVCCGWLLLGEWAVCGAADSQRGEGAALPVYRVEKDGFQASEADIRAVLDAVVGELWPFFPGYEIEPVVVTRGRNGPITLFQRNDRGEIVIRLDTEQTCWSQYSYQFAHEFCHALCGFRDVGRKHKWFEETLCGTASLFAMRAMARTWKESAPHAHWRDYRDALRNYADDVTGERSLIHEIHARGLPEFYRTYQAELEGNPTSRELNGAMSIVLLHLLEKQPERWEAVRWLNTIPPRDDDTFAMYLQNWHDAVPEKHKPFVQKLASLYGVPPVSPP